MGFGTAIPCRLAPLANKVRILPVWAKQTSLGLMSGEWRGPYDVELALLQRAQD
jgi:hypothetical protein